MRKFCEVSIFCVSGLDDILNWVLKEYVDILVVFIVVILNVFFFEVSVFCVWKLVDVLLLFKVLIVFDFNIDLWLILFILIMLKIVESFVIEKVLKFVVLFYIDLG